MKKSIKRILCSALSVALASTLIVEQALRMSADETGITTVASASFTDVTGQYDTSALRTSNFNGEVLEGTTTPTYETRSVVISLKGDNLVDAADKEGKTVSSYINSWSGELRTNEIRAEQDALLRKLTETGIPYALERRYNTVLNGVAIEVNTKHVSKIKKLSGVDSVVITTTYAEPEAITTQASASDITNATSVYQTGIYDTTEFTDVTYTGDLGEGMVVAVLDTGLDYTHSAFQREPQNPAWDKDYVKALLADPDIQLAAENGGEFDANDLYVSAKVPFAYDYADKDPDVYPSYSNHGTHVAGIIGGYDAAGYTDKDGNAITDTAFRGVVPDAQLVICKVFTDDLDDEDLGGAEATDIIAALNDCVAIGVDVINMSLGTSCGFTTTDDGDDEGELLNAVYDDIKKAGISLVCAASNDYSAGYGGVYGTNLISNPESGTVGSPSTFAAALSVASISGKKAPYMKAVDEDNNEVAAFYEESRDENSNPFDFAEQMLSKYYPGQTKGDFTYVVVPNKGRAADYTSQTKRLLSAEGVQIALVQRGDNTFQDKVEVATANGAEAIVVYNNVAGVIRMNLGEIENPIPAVSIDMDAGDALVKLAGGINKTYTITIDESLEAGPFMSDFSSWGPTHDLKIKPEITAHGGEITSTVPGGYGEQSGTSMASPNMAGVMALVRRYIETNATLRAMADDGEGDIDPVKVNRLANQLIMSTATTVRDQAGRVYSPRKQGAGLGSLDNVINHTSAFLSVSNADNDDRPKLELGDGYGEDSKYQMSFQINNFGASDLVFTPDLICVSETIAKDGLAVAEQAKTLTTESLAWSVSGNATYGVLDGDHSGVKKITVEAGKTATISVEFTLDAASIAHLEKFPNGMYVEGFLKLLSENTDQCDLTVPYLAFYGDWESSPLLDYTAYEVAASEADPAVLDENKLKASVWATQPYATYYNEKYIIPMGGYVYLLDENDEKMYAKEEYAAVSRYNIYNPDDETENYMTSTAIKAVYAGLLRNAREVQYTLTDVRTGEVILRDKCDRVGKAYAGGGSAVPANVEINLSPEQEGLLANGEYRLDFTFYMNDPDDYTVYDDPTTEVRENANNATDNYSFTFTVDYDAPVLEDVRVRYYDYKEGTKEKQKIYLDIDVYDNHYAQALMLCYPTENADGETVLMLTTEYPTPIREPNKNGTTTVTLDITDIYEEYGNQLYVQIDDYALNSCLYMIDITEAQTGLLPQNGEFELAEGEENITLGLYETHKVSLVYEGEANLSNFGWTSVNPTVAGVKNGEIVGLKAGTTKVIVHDHQQNTRTINVTVTDEVVGKLSSVPTLSFGVVKTSGEWLTKGSGGVEVSAGEEFTLKASPEPWYHPMTGITFQWETSNSAVATVDQNGVVNTIKKGTAIVTARVLRNGSPTQYVCSVTLRVAEEFDVSNFTLSKYRGIGYNGEICSVCDRAWEYDELISVTEGETTTANVCPHCYEENGLKTVVQGGVTVLKISSDLNIMYIGEEAFEDNDNIERVVVPSTVIEIQESAFESCTALKEIYFVSTASRVGNGTEIDPDNPDIDWADLSLIHPKAFYDCKSLEKLDLSNAKTITVASDGFADCVSLSEIVDLPSIGTMHHRAFKNCTSLTGTLDLTGLHVSGDNVFEGCTGITGIATDRFTALGDYMFKDCTGLSGTVTISTPIVGEGAFMGCTDLAGVRFLSPSATALEFEIGAHAFDGAGSALAQAFTVDFGEESIRSIGSYAFANTSLDALSVRFDALETMGKNPFYNTALEIIYINDTLDMSSLQLLGVPFENIELHLVGWTEGNPTVDLGNYYEANGIIIEKIGSSGKIVHVNDSVQGEQVLSQVGDYTIVEVGDYAFAGSKITSLVMQAVEKIGVGAFENANIQTVELGLLTEIPARAFYNSKIMSFAGEQVTEVGDYAFAYSAINSFYLPQATTYGDGVFEGCQALQRIELAGNGSSFSANVENVSIGNGTFAGCINLTYVEMPNVTELGEYTFNGASKLKRVSFADGATTVGSYTFAETLVESVSFGEGVEHIGEFAFYGCRKLTDVNLRYVKTIGTYAFAGCVGLEDVELKGLQNVLTADKTAIQTAAIGAGAFYGARNLTTVILPRSLNESLSLAESLIAIDAYAFADCVSLEYINLDKASVVGSLAFMNTALESVNLAAVQYIGDGAFAANTQLTSIKLGAEDRLGDYFVVDNVLYRYIDEEAESYAIVCYPAGVQAAEVKTVGKDKTETTKRVYEIAEGTLQVQAYAFYGLRQGVIDEVVLPYSVKLVGDSAFFASGIKEYTFESIDAPTLETYYRYEIQAAVENMATDSTVAYYRGYYYTNFETYLFNFTKYGTEKSALVINYPENGNGYNNHLYDTYFGVKKTTGIHMTNATRAAKTAIEDMYDTATIQSWLSLALTDANKAMVQAFSETVKEAHSNYNTIAKDATQLKLLGTENERKLFAVEENLREVKKYFGIEAKISSAECAPTSTHKAQYLVGEVFDMTGLLVTVVYDDYSTETVDASQLTLKNEAPLTKLDNYVEVVYTDGEHSETAYVMITVLDELPVENNGAIVEKDSNTLGLIVGVIAITLVVVGCVAWDFVSRRRKAKVTEGAEETLEAETTEEDNADTNADTQE
ncbi:MAG: leucine-rich repeat protein [Clostridia bacterium]|nr:leucine-rich repeat protein [Clostridia bacterium]